MEPNKKRVKKPFKLQSLLKLSNRVIEKDLRGIATELSTGIINTDKVITDLIKGDGNEEVKLDAVVQALADTTQHLINALQLVTLAGTKQWEIVEAQKGLTYKSEQSDLEKLFKLITVSNETLEASILADRKPKGKKECQCMRCKFKRAVNASKNTTQTETKSEPKETTNNINKASVIKEAKLIKLEVKDGASVEDVLAEALVKIKSGEIK